MDGLKRQLRESIQLRLSLSLSLAILVVAIVAGIFSFVSSFNEINELQDDILRQIAALFDERHIPLSHPRNNDFIKESDENSRVIIQYLSDGDKPLEDAPLLVPTTLSDGLYTMDLNGDPYRVLIKTVTHGERIAIAQATDVRDKIAQESAVQVLTPFLILVPILLLIVANLVRKMFQPIVSLATEIDSREEQELHPVEEQHVPTEMRPFVVAINRLLNRVAQSMETQRRFLADAAHELRSPLTALSLQAERLADANMSDQARERLTILRQGIERGRNLLDQLLTLARAQSTPTLSGSSTSVLQVYRRVLEDLMPLAEVKHIDIGIEGDKDAQVFVDEMDLITVVKNLVDNAIRYTPERGQIDLSVTVGERCAILQIKDSGPSIPTTERHRVFDSFYRILGSGQVGSGLGLSIVKVITDRIDADVQLTFTDEVTQSGLCVTVRVPISDPRKGPRSADHQPVQGMEPN